MPVFIGLILLIPFFSWIFKETKPIKKKYTMKDIEANNWALYDKLGISKPIWAYYPKTKETISIDSEDMLKKYYKTFDDLGIPRPSASKDSLEITIKNNSINPDLIHEWEGEKLNNFEFRPKTFKEFIGQEDGKNKAISLIKRFNRGIKSHLFVTGSQGLGKTTFINILANSLKAELIERVGSQVNCDTIIPIINEIIDSKKENVILFVDEIDGMKPEDIKILNTVIESFTLAGRPIRPFIFACATINDEKLYLNNPDFLDRIPVKIHFKKYNSEEIFQIIYQAKNQLYNEDLVEDNVINMIAKNCKFNPRVANNLLSDYIIEQNIGQVFKNNQIIKDGLTITDIKILDILNQQSKPIGEGVLSQKTGIKRKQYNIIYEPYLVEYGYINRIPSRVITDKGRLILKEINNGGISYEN